MRLPKCNKFGQSHYFNKNNVCIHCGFDYKEVIKAQDDINKEMDRLLKEKENERRN